MAQDGEAPSGRDLSNADLSGSNLAGRDFSGADLSGANLAGANLRDADLTDSDLTDADLSGANLRGVTLVGADLSGATLSGANLRDTVLEEGESGREAGSSTVAEGFLAGTVAVVVLAVALTAGAGYWLALGLGFLALPVGFRAVERYQSRFEDEEDPSGTDEQTPLARLRERYTTGEIDEAEFERRVERLLESESVDDAEAAYGDATADADPEKEVE
jgi:hypothetical protein